MAEFGGTNTREEERQRKREKEREEEREKRESSEKVSESYELRWLRELRGSGVAEWSGGRGWLREALPRARRSGGVP